MTLKKYLWWTIAVIVAILLGVGLSLYEDSTTNVASKHIAGPDVVITDTPQTASSSSAPADPGNMAGAVTGAQLSGNGTNPATGAQLSGNGANPATGAQLSGNGANPATGAQLAGNGVTTTAGSLMSGTSGSVPTQPGMAPNFPEIKIVPTHLLMPETQAITALPSNFDLHQFHPVLDESYRIMGGTLAGKWLSREDVRTHIKGGEVFNVYSQSELLGQVVSAKPGEEAQLAGETGYYVEMVKDKGYSGDCFSLGANWNPLPRLPRFDSTNVAKFLPLVQNRLYEKGLFTFPAQIKKVIYLDLEGDGIEETFIVASNISADEVHKMYNKNFTDPGNKYGLLIMQKLVKGKEENFVLYESFQSLQVYDISFFADMDGDGTVEFTASVQNLGGFLNEGFPLSVYDIFDVKKGKPIKITETNPS